MHRELSTPPNHTARGCELGLLLTQTTGFWSPYSQVPGASTQKPDLGERGPAWRRYPNHYIEAYGSPSPKWCQLTETTLVPFQLLIDWGQMNQSRLFYVVLCIIYPPTPVSLGLRISTVLHIGPLILN